MGGGEVGRGEGGTGGGVYGWADEQTQINLPLKVRGITMHSCTSYVPDKLNIYDHFIILPSSVTLTFNLRILKFFSQRIQI